MPMERAPIHPLPRNYQPAQSTPYRVKNGDRWETVASQFGVSVNKLINFNFGTNKTDEVNWYLKRNVGCNITIDGINWAFSSSANPGIIYIPMKEINFHEGDTITVKIPNGKKFNLLNVNNMTSWIEKRQSRDGGENSYDINVTKGVDEFHEKLSEALQLRFTFKKAVFTTHGNEGLIAFNDQIINADILYSRYYNRGFDRLFPGRTRILFNGCNVAGGDAGWRFLLAAARSFLRVGGGEIFAWTSTGYGTFGAGHVRHYSGNVRSVFVSAGGDSFRFYENWKLIEKDGYPDVPDALKGILHN
jgi:LysM domain